MRRGQRTEWIQTPAVKKSYAKKSLLDGGDKPSQTVWLCTIEVQRANVTKIRQPERERERGRGERMEVGGVGWG